MSKKVKVLVVESTKFGYDGITNVITNYYKHLDHDRIHMDIVTINNISNSFKEELKTQGNKNYVLPYRNSNPIRYVLSLYKILKKEGYQIIHVHGCSATMAVEMLASKLSGVKIRISHSHNTKCDHGKIDKLLRPMFLRWCNTYFACGKEAGEWLFPGKKFTVVSNGIDLDKFRYNENVRKQMREAYSLDEKFIIGHVGRFSEQKNHKKLIEICSVITKKHNNVKLVLVGDGELKSDIQMKAKDAKLDVLFVGVSDEVEKWFQAMDVLVFPSLYEGLPLVLIEAQASGLQCVLSDTISSSVKITELVKVVGLCESAEAWAEVISQSSKTHNRVKSNPNIRKQIQEAHYDIETNCEDLTRLYEELASGGVL